MSLNVIINNACTLKCKYCFAKDLTEQEHEEMSIENFLKILDYFEKENVTTLKILGGEPTSHSNFFTFLELFLLRFENKNKRILIFSNCAFNNDTLVKLLQLNRDYSGVIEILPNINEPRDVGNHLWLNTVNNINFLVKEKMVSSFGINIYSENQSYEEFLKLAKRNEITCIRMAFAVNLDKTQEKYPKEKIKKFATFINDCIDNGMIPHLDCNTIPMCDFNSELYEAYIKQEYASVTAIDAKFKKDMIYKCEPVVDIDYKMRVHRCFGFSSDSDIYLDFDMKKSLPEYRKEFYQIIDSNLRTKDLYEDKCGTCNLKQFNPESICGCLSYRKE